MKIIIDTDTATDNITALVASSEDASFPVENLRDDYTTNLWKATGTTAKLTLSVSKGSAVELLNTNATSATVSAGTGGTYELEAGYSLEDGYSLENDESVVSTVYNLPGTAGRLWAEWDNFTVPFVVTIALVASSVVSAGIVRAGNVEEFSGVAYGAGETSRDFSIERELNNGADYFRKRNVIRTFDNLTIVETRANCWKFKHAIFDAVGPKPLAIRLIHGTITDNEFVLFAKRVDPPRIVHDINKDYSHIHFNLREVV